MAIQDEESNLPLLLGYWPCDCDLTTLIKAAWTGIEHYQSPFSLPALGLMFSVRTYSNLKRCPTCTLGFGVLSVPVHANSLKGQGERKHGSTKSGACLRIVCVHLEGRQRSHVRGKDENRQTEIVEFFGHRNLGGVPEASAQI
jgi:hypothetical protein